MKEYQDIIKGLQELRANITDQEASDNLQEAMDIIADYKAAVVQNIELHKKYEIAAPAIDRGMDFYQCPACGKRTGRNHTHCHWCGKKLSWNQGPRRKGRR